MFRTPGDALGRYTILGLLGAGGMGAVYKARDGELERIVALKVLRSTAGVASVAERARFLAEAQTLARLNHPNIVTIYDGGEVGGQLFIAMELIDGVSLREWLLDRPRSWREVREVFVAAARGLDAAHRLGIIHRDFKPHNVIIAAERVVVVDFGLARPVDRAAAVSGGALDVPISGDVSLTATGDVVGTPAYMSPEQHDGVDLTARSDIWSFCVALFEALHGRRPFHAATAGDLSLKIRRRPLVVPPGPRVPRFLVSLIQRGLSVDPDERPASMKEVIADLTRDPARRALRVAAAVVLAGTLAGGYALARETPSPCRGAGGALDAVWDAGQRGRLQAAFAPAGQLAADSGARAARGLDRYAAEWRTMRVEACRATFERGTQSAALLDQRMACLDRRRDSLASLVHVLGSDVDRELANRAVALVAGLPPLEPCADARALAERVSLPDEPGLRAAAVELERELGSVEALISAGKLVRAAAAMPVTLVAAGMPYAPLRARALYLVGRFLRLSVPNETRPVFEAALHAAAAARDDGLVADIWLAVLATPRVDAATDAWLAAEAAAERAGGDVRRLAMAKSAHGQRLNELRHFSEATPHLERAVALLRARPRASDPALVYALRSLSQAQHGQLDYAAARRSAEEALELAEEVVGPGHVEVAHALMALGNSSTDNDECERAYARARDIYAASLGPDHENTLLAWNNLALVLRRRGRQAEAAAIYRQMTATLERANAPSNATLIRTRLQLGSTLRVLKELEEAERTGRGALEVARAGLEPGDPLLATVRGELALTLMKRGKTEEALEQSEAALRGIDKLAETAGTRMFVVQGLGEALVKLGRHEEGVRRLDQVLKMADLDPRLQNRARVRAGVAQTLWQVPAQRARALEVGRAAEKDFAAAGLIEDEKGIHGWMAEVSGKRAGR